MPIDARCPSLLSHVCSEGITCRVRIRVVKISTSSYINKMIITLILTAATRFFLTQKSCAAK
ncbi:hypothetical protein Hanom_Chr10g00949961 [Helianthus anomalus]